MANPILQIYIQTYHDLEFLEKALDSIPKTNKIKTYVVDGRYANFEGEKNLTINAERLCKNTKNTQYTHPPNLPIGDPEKPSDLRHPQHVEAKYINYQLLDPDTWTLKMDSDETIQNIQLSILDELHPKQKYSAKVETPNGKELRPAIRIYKPKYWTFWIDDAFLYREYYPRDTPLKKLYTTYLHTKHANIGYGGTVEQIKLLNRGVERPDEYRRRRAKQLEEMDRELAAKAVRMDRYPSTLSDKEIRELGYKRKPE